MKKIKPGRYKVLICAAAIILAGSCILLTSVTIAQGAEENRIIAEQSENAGFDLALASAAQTAVPESTPANAIDTEAVIGTPAPSPTAAGTPGPEFITEEEAKDAYILTAKEIFGLKVDKGKLTAEFNSDAPHEQWRVTSKDTDCYIDAISGEVLIFYSSYENRYTGETITLEKYENDPAYSCEAYEDPNNAYIRAAAGIVNAKLANGRVIAEITVGATQFVCADDKEGSEPDSKGTIQTDVYVIMDSGRCYVLSFLGTKEIVLSIFNSYPSKEACFSGYFYEEEAGIWGANDSAWQTAPGIENGTYAVSGGRR